MENITKILFQHENLMNFYQVKVESIQPLKFFQELDTTDQNLYVTWVQWMISTFITVFRFALELNQNTGRLVDLARHPNLDVKCEGAGCLLSWYQGGWSRCEFLVLQKPTNFEYAPWVHKKNASIPLNCVGHADPNWKSVD